MMGTKIRDFTPLPNLSLEELVPKDNFYRRLEAMLDLSFVRELVKNCYASSGHPSVDPVVFFRLQLVMFFGDIRSERQLMEIAADRLSIRWYLGYDLHEPLPYHSSLTYIRQRYGLEVFRRFFEEIVQLCIEAGLVWGKELYFDSTKVKANADIDSLRSRSIAENHLKELFAEIGGPQKKKIEDFSTPHLSPDASAIDALPPIGEEALKENEAQKKGKDWISRDGRQERAFSSGPRQRTADRLLSTSDPDATPMRVGESETKLGYFLWTSLGLVSHWIVRISLLLAAVLVLVVILRWSYRRAMRTRRENPKESSLDRPGAGECDPSLDLPRRKDRSTDGSADPRV